MAGNSKMFSSQRIHPPLIQHYPGILYGIIVTITGINESVLAISRWDGRLCLHKSVWRAAAEEKERELTVYCKSAGKKTVHIAI